ncbi:hypothetical protein [Dyella sp.]|uniref:hypothetical protein n=1 Tax=Dyella sp. TaxID=1869338 RepID=UPI003F7F3747
MNSDPRPDEEIIADVIAGASALAAMAERWLPVEQWSGNLAGADAIVIGLTRLLGELRRVRHGR